MKKQDKNRNKKPYQKQKCNWKIFNDHISTLVNVKKEINYGDKMIIIRNILIQFAFKSIDELNTTFSKTRAITTSSAI